jgi:hypothetical protein
VAFFRHDVVTAARHGQSAQALVTGRRCARFETESLSVGCLRCSAQGGVHGVAVTRLARVGRSWAERSLSCDAVLVAVGGHRGKFAWRRPLCVLREGESHAQHPSSPVLDRGPREGRGAFFDEASSLRARLKSGRQNIASKAFDTRRYLGTGADKAGLDRLNEGVSDDAGAAGGPHSAEGAS